MKPETLRVRAPTSVVFLCGGAIDETLDAPAVLRDAFRRVAKLSAPKYEIVLAESAKPLTSEAGYDNLLTFESDIAQVVGLILLFVESAGSLAELGAFAAMPTVSPKLLAVVEDFHYSQTSFVRQGPIQYLEVTQGEESIISLDRAELGIDEHGKISGLNTEKFSAALLPVVQKRIDELPQSEKFNPQNAGHVILLIVGLCQEYGALMQSEIKAHLKTLGVTEVRFEHFIYCARLLNWIDKTRNGNNIYYVAKVATTAIEFQFKDDVKYRDKSRWRSDIRAFWQKNDVSRHNAIIKVIAPGASS